MSNLVQVNQEQNQVKPLDPAAVEAVLLGGDLSRLTPAQRVDYYQKVCHAVGLNPLTKPFDYLELNRKLVLYANKGCAEQLRAVHKISIRIADKQKFDDLYVVTAEAADPYNRRDSATGAVNLANLKGEALANALMKAETKAKRRVTLSICGLNMLDDTEVDTVKGAKRLDADFVHTNSTVSNPVTVDHPGDDEGGGFNPLYIIPFGSLKGSSIQYVLDKSGVSALIDAVEKTEGALERGAIYKGSSVEEMKNFIQLATHAIRKFETPPWEDME